MALLRNIAGVHKLGLVGPEADMQKPMPDENGGGGGSYYDPVYYDEEPEKEPDPVKPADPMPKDFGGGGGAPMDGGNFQPDGTGSEPGPSDQQPVYPILPIREYEEEPPAPVETPNTVKVTNNGNGTGAVDLAALGVLSGVFFMILAGRPKGAMGTIAFAGGLGILYLRLKNVQTVQQPANAQ